MIINRFKNEYLFLSNFYYSPIIYKGIEFPSVENAYQAMKTTDKKKWFEFIDCSAGDAKRKGKRLKIRDDWDQVKFGIMEELVELKFAIPDLRELLRLTNDSELTEGNWWKDTYWGVCNGVGQNNLGKILMSTRSKIRDFE